MRASEVFFSLVALFFSLFLAFAGLFFLFISLLPDFFAVYLKFISQPSLLIWMGCIFFACGISLLAVFFAMNQRRYWLIKMGGGRALLMEEAVFRSVTEKCFKELFPREKFHCKVFIKKREKMEIVADLPFLPLNEQNKALEHIEIQLEKAFFDLCGYSKEFLLNVRFCE